MHIHSVTLAGVVALAVSVGPTVAAPVALDTFIPVPANTTVNPSGAFRAFDISFADSVTGDIYIADRSNAGVDIFSGSSLQFINRATGFVGVQPPPPAAPNN